MMRIETFKPEHVTQMDLRPLEQALLEANPKTLGYIQVLAKQGTGVTLFLDELILAAFGVFELWPRVYEIWAFPSTHLKRNAMLYLRTVRRYLRAFEETHSPQRIQSTAFSGEDHDRWLRFLGLTCETPNGMPRYYATGHTANLWSKTY